MKHTLWSDELVQDLCAPMDESHEQYLPRGFKGTKGTAARAMGLLYIGSEAIIERLNSLVGPQGWEFSADVEYAGEGKVVMKGALTVLGATHHDYGEAHGEDELFKSARTDAFKRCARDFGLGLYAWNMPTIWGQHDGWKWVEEPKPSPAARNRALRMSGYRGTIPTGAPAAQQAQPEPARAVTAPPRPAAKPAVEEEEERSETTPSAAPTCESCGVLLRPAQVTLAQHHYGKTLCARCYPKKDA